MLLLRAVLFDLDGTLADTVRLCVKAFRKSIEPAVGRAVSDAEIMATFGPSEEGTIQALAPEKYDQGLADYLKHYRSLHSECPETFEGLRELLHVLRCRGTLLGLVTGKGAASTRISLEQFGLVNAFDAIETGSPLGSRKEEALRNILVQWRVPPNQAVYIGDSAQDIVSSHAVGVMSIAAAWASTSDAVALRAERPTAIISTIEELKGWLFLRI